MTRSTLIALLILGFPCAFLHAARGDRSISRPTSTLGWDTLAVEQRVVPGYLASTGTVIPLIADPTVLTGHRYGVTFHFDSAGSTLWNLTDITTNEIRLRDQRNLSGDANYVVVDGFLVKVIGAFTHGMRSWSIPSGVRRFSPVGGFYGLGLEGFSNAGDPYAYDSTMGTIGSAGNFTFGGIGTSLKPTEYHSVLLKLAAVDNVNLWDPRSTPADTNFSRAYRFLRASTNAPAQAAFAPWIIHAATGYPYQGFDYSVPFSAWDMDTDPPTRLAVGSFENNVTTGAVDGRYWPGTTSGDNSFTREFAFIFNRPYSTTPDSTLAVNLANNASTPLMWVLTCARRSESPWMAGDEFLISAHHPFNAGNSYEFTAVRKPYADGPGWITQTSATDAALIAVSFADSSIGCAVGIGGTIRHTSDGGRTWRNQESGTTQTLLAVVLQDSVTGTVVGDSGVVLHTTDAGRSWARLFTDASYSFRSVSFSDRRNGFILATRGLILHTTNGGSTWGRLETPDSVFLGWISSPDSMTCIAAGYEGEILRTSDAGVTWTFSRIPRMYGVHGVDFVSESSGILLEGGAIYRTTDDGTTWVLKHFSYTESYRDAAFSDSTNGIAVGFYGTILLTSDGGESWVSQPTGAKHYLNGVAFPDRRHATVVGDHGAILHTSTGGSLTSVEEISQIVPDTPVLCAAYPNPFNGSTNLTFTLSRRSHARLTIFDILGREVAVLLSEELPAGSHHRTWDAGHAASGVYFYRLQSEFESGESGRTAVQTGRVLLLR